MKPLYEITKEIDVILESAPDGELTDDLAASLDRIQLAWEEKAQNCCRAIRNWLTAAAGLETEAARLLARARSLDNKAAWLKNYVRNNMEKLGTCTMKLADFTLTICANSRPRITWAGDPMALPGEYTKTVISLDGDKAWQAWRTGTLPKGFIAEIGQHLRIT